MLIHDPLLGPGGDQVGGIAFVEVRHDVGGAVIDIGAGFLRIVVVGVAMFEIAEKIIEAAQLRAAGSREPAALQAPLADGGGGVAGLPHHGAQRVVVFQLLVELVVAHVGVALVDT